jgi:hypothetical protein
MLHLAGAKSLYSLNLSFFCTYSIIIKLAKEKKGKAKDL